MTSKSVSVTAVPRRRRYGSLQWRRRLLWWAPLFVWCAAVLLWQAVATTISSELLLPTPVDLLRHLLSDGWTFYGPNISATVGAAAQGWLLGNLAALLLVAITLIVPAAERLVMRVSLVAFALPNIAVGILLAAALGIGPARIGLATLAVFYTTVIGAIAGLHAADTSSVDLIRAMGGNRWHEIRKLRMKAALPSLLSALQIAAPAAILGAIIGEYLGANDGLGVAMINGERMVMVARTWDAAIVAGLVATVGYELTAFVRRFATPWSTERSIGAGFGPALARGRTARRSSRWRRYGTAIAGIVATSGVLLLLWMGFLEVFRVNPFIGKTPVDVWNYVVSSSQAGANRSQLISEVLATLRDTGAGLVCGVAAATMGAMAVGVSPTLRRSVMPFATILQAVPLVAMTPLIVVSVGRGLAGVIVIVAVVTFFPVLVILSNALASVSKQEIEMCVALGASRTRTLRTVRLPATVPAFFASLRISAPLALVGAIVAEFLATGRGLGNAMANAVGLSDYTGLWTLVVISTALSLGIYALVNCAESVTRRRMTGTA